MVSKLNPYLNFRDTAREAMDFYQSVFGGDVNRMTFADAPGMPGVGDSDADKVMHSQLETPGGFTLMVADTPAYLETVPPNGQISLSGEDEAELRGYWDRLVEGGTVGVPLERAPWGDHFGMLTDRFGVNWMVNIAGS